jgi:hypothetical protein
MVRSHDEKLDREWDTPSPPPENVELRGDSFPPLWITIPGFLLVVVIVTIFFGLLIFK